MAYFAATITCSAQEVRTIYFSDKKMENEVSADKAKFAQTTTRYADGGVFIEEKDLRKNQIIDSHGHKGNEPIGKWINSYSKDTLHFDFQLEYSSSKCAEAGQGIEYFMDNASTGYTAPKIIGYESIFKLLQSNLRYPAHARRTGTQGSVFVTFTITKTGTVEKVVVNDGVSVDLDKEAVRVIRLLKLAPPANKGEHQEVCITMPIKFKLA